MRNTEKIRRLLQNAPKGDKLDRLTILTEADIKEIFLELNEIDLLITNRREYQKEYYLRNKEKITQQAKQRYRQKKSS